MDKYEELIYEYADELDISEQEMKNKGLYADSTVWINKNMNTQEKTCILAEEIGHHKTTFGDILDQTNVSNIKQEKKARAWAYDRLIPLDDLQAAYKSGIFELYEMAEYFGVSEDFLQNCLDYYSSKYGEDIFSIKNQKFINALSQFVTE